MRFMHTDFSFCCIELVKCREVVESMMKVGETTARLKQLEVALDAAELGKQKAEAETILAKEKAELSKTEVKHIDMMVCSNCMFNHSIRLLVFLVL